MATLPTPTQMPETFYQRHPLEVFFAPRAVAVIGATEKAGSVGRTILWNLINHPFRGTIFPVNPKRTHVLGIKTYPTIADVPEPVDLALVVTPALTVPNVIAACVDAGVKGAIIISAGFRERGAEGAALAQEVLEQARRGKLRIIGPNCLGVMSSQTGLNATVANTIALPGNIGFISQSGTLFTAVLDWSLREHVGFSAFISIGSMLDVGWGDLIDYLGNDPHTKSILLYMESINDAQSFLSAAREVALTKPIIVIKAGKTAAAARAAVSHTGSLAGSNEVFEAAFRRCGVLRVNSIADLFAMAEVLAKQPRPKGPRLTIVTNAGGPGVLATDALIGSNGELTPLAPTTITALNKILPAHWSHDNPIDILGDADPERYANAVEIAARDPNSDGLLVMLAPQAMTDPTQTAAGVKTAVQKVNKPVLASWMGGAEVAAGEAILNQAKIPTFAYPDDAARVFTKMWQYSTNLRSLYETPTMLSGADAPDRAEAARIIQAARTAGRTILTEVESKQVLAAYGIPTVETHIATTVEMAIKQAEELGYPVVLKLLSEIITHKTDVGGVYLNLLNAAAVQQAYHAIEAAVSENIGSQHFAGVTVQPMIKHDGYELIIGSSVDPQFGPVLLFGAGGQLTEVFKDRALGLPPLNTTLAHRMIERTRIFTALRDGHRYKPIDLAALDQLLVRFSQLVVEQRWIKEMDINPLLANAVRLLTLDARIVLHDPEVSEDAIPSLAIRPYPLHYVVPWTMKDGTSITFRPIRPEDEPLMTAFHRTLSDQSVYFRYLHPIKLDDRVAHERLTQICFIDYDRAMALVVEHRNPETSAPEIIAVGRLTKLQATRDAEFALLVSDQFQGSGLGTELMRRLIQVGRDEHLQRIIGYILSENQAMLGICKRLGFQRRRATYPVEVVLDLEKDSN